MIAFFKVTTLVENEETRNTERIQNFRQKCSYMSNNTTLVNIQNFLYILLAERKYLLVLFR